MSVIVKGMEMPSKCRECGLMDYDLYTGKTWCFPADAILADDYKPIGFNGRPEWCPLVALPEKHGRLIDADELKGQYPHDSDWEYPVNTNEYVVQTINEASTIIEAEE